MPRDLGRKPAPPVKRDGEQIADRSARGLPVVMARAMRPASELLTEFSALIESDAPDAEVIARAREIEQQLSSRFKALHVGVLERYLGGSFRLAYRRGLKAKREAFTEAAKQ